MIIYGWSTSTQKNYYQWFFFAFSASKIWNVVLANNPIIQTINIFMAFIKKNFLYHASTMCVAESSEDFGRVCDSSYSEVSSSDGSSN